MKAANIITTVLALLVTLPIWYYLVWYMLTAIKASELAWFLFYIYVPVGILAAIIKAIMEGVKD